MDLAVPPSPDPRVAGNGNGDPGTASGRGGNALLARALDAAGIGAFVWHAADGRWEVDDIAASLLALPERGNVDVLAGLVAEDRERCRQALAAAMGAAGEGGLQEDFQVMGPDGEIRWVSVSGRAHGGGRGELSAGVSGVIQEVTWRKKVEALRQAPAANRIHGFDYDVRSETASCSPEYHAVFGLSANGDVSRELWLEWVHPEDRYRVERELREALAGDTTVYESDYRVVNGEDREKQWVRATGSIQRDAEGAALRVIGTHVDITGPKLAEDTLRADERRQWFLFKLGEALRPERDPEKIQEIAARMLATLLGAQRAGYAKIDDDGEVATVDDHFVDGLPRIDGRYSLKDYGPTLPREMRAGHTVARPDIAADPELTAGEKAALGELGIASMLNKPLLKEGKLLAILFLHYATPRQLGADETHFVEEVAERTWAAVERSRAEQALRASEEKYRSLFESIDEGFCLIEICFDGNGKPYDYIFLEANPALERHTGLRQVIGRSIREMVPDLEEQWFEAYGGVVRTGRPLRFEGYSDVMGRVFDLYAFSVGGPGRNQVAVLFNDVTERWNTARAVAQDLADTALLRDLAVRRVSGRDLQATFDDLNLAAMKLTHSDGATVQILDPATCELVMTSSRGFPPDAATRYGRVNVTSTTSCGTALAAGKRCELDFDDPAMPDPKGDLRWHREAGYLSAQSTPLISRSGGPIGMLSTHWKKHHRLTEREIRYLDLLSRQAADLIERWQGDTELKASREHLELVLESASGHAIITLDSGGIVTGWNPGAASAFGYTAREIIGRSGQVLFTPEDREQGMMEHEMETARKKGRAPDERWHLRKDGERFWVSGVMSPLVRRGRIDGYVKVARDLTEQRRSEAALRESEARIRGLSDAVPQLVWMNSPGGDAVYFNRRWHEYTGLDRMDSGGWGWRSVLHPQEAQAVSRGWNKARVEGTVYETEYRLRRADGCYRWFICRCIPLRDDAGQIIGWCGSATDIEDLKNAERALRESEERLRFAMDAAAIAAWDWDLQTGQVVWSHRHFVLLGVPPDEITRTPEYFLTFVHPEDRDPLSARMAGAIGQAGDFRAEFRIIRGDGEIRWLRAFGRTVAEAGGKAIRVAGVTYDCTDSKVAAQTLQQANDELEVKVAERTSELARAIVDLRREARERKKIESARHRLLKRLVRTQEEERERISRELHDNLGQHMVAVMMELENLGSRATPAEGGEAEPLNLDHLRKYLENLLKAAHRQAWELRPAELNHFGLEVALANYVTDWSGRTGVRAVFESSGDPPATSLPETDIAIYRVVQESLTNVARHARATRVEIVLGFSDKISVVIRDDGAGFDPKLVVGRLGLLGMKERMLSVKGSLDIMSAKGKGTEIHVNVPMR